MGDPIHPKSIVILDFGGQYAHLIASRIRRFGYKSFILPAETEASTLKKAAGIILSGGPQSVYDKGSPQADLKIFDLGIPVLGLCYGQHWIGHVLGGKTTSANVKEYGQTEISVVEPQSTLFTGLPKSFTVWMSHGDEVVRLPLGFITVASSKDCVNAAMENPKYRIFGIQFHIEVAHTEHGFELLRRFVDLCAPAPWSVESYSAEVSEQIQREVGERKVFMLVSGGVDSTVAFTLFNKVLGPKRVEGLLIDTGLMRKGEITAIQAAFKKIGIKNLQVKDASKQFFRNLREIYDPEEKRRIIGETFIQVQKQVFEEMGLRTQDWLLGQGTIYPDTIETGGTKHADKIKTHHNRVEIIQTMIEEGLVIEPLKDLYKDEVRELGEELGLPHELVWRHPFPGPGLGVRILCAKDPDKSESRSMKYEKISDFDFRHSSFVLPIRSVGVQGDSRTYRHALALFAKEKFPSDSHYQLATEIPNSDRSINRVLFCLSHAEPFVPTFTPMFITREVADLLREADAIAHEEIRGVKLYEAIWQFPVVLLPVGASDRKRSVVLRPIDSTDAMTASAFRLPIQILERITERILTLDGIDVVFLDLTNKPPATIEWE